MVAFNKIRTEVYMFQDDDSNTGTVLISFLIGGIIGAGVALLLAPQSGRKTRKHLIDTAEDVRDYASGYAKKLKEKIS
jgi:gas vesicle protein